jgi:magnesium chelatase subunit D
MKIRNVYGSAPLGRPVYPFTAIVGQDQLLLALLLNAIQPRLSGVLVRGEKGTAKSTAVRALADLLPEVEVVSDCPFGCHPHKKNKMCLQCRQRVSGGDLLPAKMRKVQVIDLPLGSTEDRVVGSVDFEHALQKGEKRVEMGMLAAANRNIVYVDEVNLLDDHIVNLLLDTIVSGINIIEREGISFTHPSEFALVGTMNPEEGELRPQLLDRFGLCVSIEGISDVESRVHVVERREAFDTDPAGFCEEWAPRQEAMRARVSRARERLPQVRISEKTRFFISQICLLNQVDGHRADILLEKAARTIAAFNDRAAPTLADLRQAAELVLPHRSRSAETLKNALEDFYRMLTDELHFDEAILLESIDAESCVKGGDDDEEPETSEHPETLESDTDSEMPGYESRVRNHSPKKSLFGASETFRVPPLPIDRDRTVRKKIGRRIPTRTMLKKGRYVRATAERRNGDIAFDATIRVAAPYQKSRPKRDVAIAIEASDIRERVRETKAGCLVLFVVDASGSMGTRLMTETKAAMISLLLDAYQKRDKVALVSFREESAEVLLPPTNSTELAKKLLEDLPTGGKTPLGHGLLEAFELLQNTMRRDPYSSPLMVLVSDGEANVGVHPDKCYEGHGHSMLLDELFEIAKRIREDKRIRALVIDTEGKGSSIFYNPAASDSMARRIAKAMGASYCKIEDFRAGGIVRAVKQQI